MELTVEQLEPGQMVKTPPLLVNLGYDQAGVIFAGEQGGYPSFVTDHGTALAWPAGAGGKPAPLPKFEPTKYEKLQELRRAQLAKGQWQSLRYGYQSGTDPEFFVLDSKGEVIPARHFLKSKALNPTRFYDGLQAEVAPQGQSCLEQLSKYLYEELCNVDWAAKKLDKAARVTIRNSFSFTSEQMSGFTDEDVRFRCSSSMNIYDDSGELPDAREYLHRFAGGHIHIGCGPKSAKVSKAMVCALDAILGVAGVSLARNWDNPERRRMYGRAGEFRLPKHGLEYRVLSNFWLCSPLIFHLVFELMRYAYRIGESGALADVYNGTEDEIRSCINHCDVKLAEKLIERNAVLYANIFRRVWADPSYRNSSARAMETLRNGIEVAVSNPDDVMNNWARGYGSSYPATWGRTFA